MVAGVRDALGQRFVHEPPDVEQAVTLVRARWFDKTKAVHREHPEWMLAEEEVTSAGVDGAQDGLR